MNRWTDEPASLGIYTDDIMASFPSEGTRATKTIVCPERETNIATPSVLVVISLKRRKATVKL